MRELAVRRTAVELVASALRDAINGGRLGEGATLNAVALADHFGVSRVPVREAMRQLVAEGLVVAPPHRQAVVRALTVERLAETYDVRALVEGYLVERAVPNLGPAQLRGLSDLASELRATTDAHAWLALNARLHRALCEPSGAETVLELADQLRARAERHTRLCSRGRAVDGRREAERDHAEILRIVRRGDGPAARRAVEAHIRRSRDRALRRSRPDGLTQP